MPKLKVGTVLPSMKEDAAITEAAIQDADASPYTDEEWATVESKSKRSHLAEDATMIQTSTRVDL